MVAYGFQPMFVDGIVARTKRQTIRGHRKRHARPGERVQLYQGLRTRSCRKLIPDPVCVGLDEVRFDLRALSGVDPEEGRPDWRDAVKLEVNGIPLQACDLTDYYAGVDGFVARKCQDGHLISPFEHMTRWWLYEHGPVLFEGLAIRWEDRP